MRSGENYKCAKANALSILVQTGRLPWPCNTLCKSHCAHNLPHPASPLHRFAFNGIAIGMLLFVCTQAQRTPALRRINFDNSAIPGTPHNPRKPDPSTSRLQIRAPELAIPLL